MPSSMIRWCNMLLSSTKCSLAARGIIRQPSGSDDPIKVSNQLPLPLFPLSLLLLPLRQPFLICYFSSSSNFHPLSISSSSSSFHSFSFSDIQTMPEAKFMDKLTRVGLECQSILAYFQPILIFPEKSRFL